MASSGKIAPPAPRPSACSTIPRIRSTLPRRSPTTEFIWQSATRRTPTPAHTTGAPFAPLRQLPRQLVRQPLRQLVRPLLRQLVRQLVRQLSTEEGVRTPPI